MNLWKNGDNFLFIYSMIICLFVPPLCLFYKTGNLIKLNPFFCDCSEQVSKLSPKFIFVFYVNH